MPILRAYSALSSRHASADRRVDEEVLQSFIGGGFFEVVDFGGCEESESANSEAVVGDFADACSLEGFDGQADATNIKIRPSVVTCSASVL